jgi:tetratricopeptide (TPR) repeat protein
MPIEGRLSDLGIQDVLQLLDLTRKTGTCTVKSERMHDDATIVFDRGAIVFAHRRRSLRRLGQQLLRAGKITERELQRALDIQKAGEQRRFAEILLEMGSVSEEEIERHVRFQIEETVYDLMGWQDGEFRFEEQDAVPLGLVPVRVKVESLLMEGARRIDEWSRLEPLIPSLEAVPVLSDSVETLAGPLDLRPDEWEVLAEIDGARDIRQIAAGLGRSSFDVAKIIFGLLTTGVLSIDEHSGKPQRPLEPALDELKRLLGKGDLEAAVKLGEELGHTYPEHGEIPLLVGRAMISQGRLRAATESFAKAVTLDPLEPEAHYHFGFAAVQIGDFGRAEHAWGNYLRLTPNGGRRTIVAQALEAVRSLNRILDTNGKLSLS